MHYEADYWVESVTQSRDGATFEAKKHGRRSMKGRTLIDGLPVPEDVELEPGDVVRLKIENHSEESGRSNRSWALERFIGFHYDEERSCDMCR